MQAKDDLYRIKSDFEGKHSDYNIDIPSIMFYKINETMKLSVDFWVEQFEPSTN